LIGVALAALAVGWARAATFQEDFAADPATRGWKVHGEASTFRWNPEAQNLEATWDSRRTNSYFHRALGTVLTTNDHFSLAFDLRLREVAVGIDTNQPFTFPLAIGLINFRTATNENLCRGVGVNPAYGPRNLVEFDYFPDSGFGATIAPTVVSTNNRFAYAHSFPLELTPEDLFRVEMTYTASNRVLRTRLTRNGAPFGLPPDNLIEDVLMAGTPDFRVDTLAVSSYSDERADGSILARGTLDNFVVALPPPPVRNLAGTVSNGHFQAQFDGDAPWLYALERSKDSQSWTEVASSPVAVGTGLRLQDPEPLPDGMAWYRVRAERP
jgi:hypothetical protein